MAKGFTKKVKDIDKGWNDIKKQLKVLDGSYTKVGIQADAGKHEESGEDLTVIAATNEWGTDNAGVNKNVHIPERSFLRAGIDENLKKIQNFTKELVGKVEDLKISAKRAVGLLGEFGEGVIKAKMTQLKTPANAASTIKRKGSSNPLIADGELHNAIRHEDHVK